MSQPDEGTELVRDLVRAAIAVDEAESALDAAQKTLKDAEKAVADGSALPLQSLAVVTVDGQTYTVFRDRYRDFKYDQARVVV